MEKGQIQSTGCCGIEGGLPWSHGGSTEGFFRGKLKYWQFHRAHWCRGRSISTGLGQHSKRVNQS